MPKDPAHALKYAIIEFYRDEMSNRYRLDNIRRFEQFSGIPDEQIHELRSYFMERIYPPSKDRERLDAAIDRLGDVIKSPKRLKPLVGATLKGILKLGASLPAAVGAGTSTLDAYLEARKLEATMLKTALGQGLTAEDARDRDRMLRIMTEIPEREVKRLIRDIMKLFHVLSNTKMLQTAIDFLEQCRAIMAERPELYTADEVEGITLGRDMVQGGLDLFLDVQADQFEHIIEGIEQVELDWYHGIMASLQGA